MKKKKLNEIYHRLQGKPFLRVIETSVCRIPERLEEYDYDMFICYDSLLQEYQIHSLSNKERNTFALSVPWKELDERIIEYIYLRDQKKRSLKEIIREIDQKNEEREARNKRHRRSEINAWARENRNVFKRYADEYY